MALASTTRLFGVSDAKIFPITEDSSSAYTCSTGIDIPGIKNFEITPEILSAKLTGDNKTLDVDSLVQDLGFSFECAKIDNDMLNQLLGGTKSSSGTTPNQKNVYSQLDGDKPKEVQLAFLVDGVDLGLGCVNLHIMKATVTAIPIGGAENAHATLKISGTGAFTKHLFTRGGKTKSMLFEIEEYETLAALSAIVDSGST